MKKFGIAYQNKMSTSESNTYIISALQINGNWMCLFNGVNRKEFVSTTPDEAAKELCSKWDSKDPIYFRFENTKTGELYSYKRIDGVVSVWEDPSTYEITEIKIGDQRLLFVKEGAMLPSTTQEQLVIPASSFDFAIDTKIVANSPAQAAWKLAQEISSTKPMYFRFRHAETNNSYRYKYVDGFLSEWQDEIARLKIALYNIKCGDLAESLIDETDEQGTIFRLKKALENNS